MVSTTAIGRRSLVGSLLGVGAITMLAFVGYSIGGGAGPKVLAFVAVVVVSLWGLVALARLDLGRLAMASLVVAACLAPMNNVRPSTVLTAADVFLVAVFALVVVEVLLGRRQVHLVWPGSTIVLGTVVVLAGGLVGTLVGGQQRVRSLADLTRFGVAAVVTVAVIAALAPTMGQVRRVMHAWLLGVSISVLAGQQPSNRVFDRSLGLTTHPNHLGLTCVLAAPVALALSFSARGWRRAVLTAAFLLSTFGVIESGSRAALFGYGVAVLLVLARLASPAAFMASVAAAMVALVLVLAGVISVQGQGAVGRVLGAEGTTQSNTERTEALNETLDTIGSFPLTGIGFEQAKAGHNTYLQIWQAAGLAGLAGFVVIMVAALRSSWVPRGAVGTGPMAGRSVLVGMGSALAGFFAASLFQNILWDRYLWVFIAMLAAAATASRAEPASTEPVDTAADSGAAPVEPAEASVADER